MNNFNSSKHCLGILCKRNHQWQDSGKTLRYIKGNDCVECTLTRAIRWKHSHPEAIKESGLKYYEKNKETILAKTIAWQKLNKDKIIKNNKKYSQTAAGKQVAKKYKQSQKGREAIARYNRSEKAKLAQKKVGNERHKRFRLTFKGKLWRRRSNNQRRLKKYQSHSIPYTQQQLNERYTNLFDNKCAYCLKNGKLTNDHFIALFRGGSDVISNIVPACLRCNSSKNNRDPKEWYFAQSFYSKKQWKAILKAVGKTDANYNQIPLL